LKFFAFAALVCGLLAIPGHPRQIGAFILLASIFLLVSPICLIPHEAGHALAGKLLGYRIFSVTIGAGPIVWRHRILGTDFEWRLLPTGGSVIAAPTLSKYLRLRIILFHAAGPLANAVVSMSLIWAAIQHDISFERLGAGALPLYLCLLPNLACAFFSLWPSTVRIRGERKPSDGLGILRALFWPKQPPDCTYTRAVCEAAHAMALDEYTIAERWAEDALASEERPGAARILLAVLRLQHDEVEVAWDLLSPLRAQAGEPGGLSSDNVFLMSYTALLVATQEAFDEGLALVGTTQTHTGRSDPKIDGMRGCLLIATGQIDAGLSIGRAAFGNPTLDRTILPDLACFLAEGENARGNTREANLYAQIAREMGANSRLLARESMTLVTSR